MLNIGFYAWYLIVYIQKLNHLKGTASDRQHFVQAAKCMEGIFLYTVTCSVLSSPHIFHGGDKDMHVIVMVSLTPKVFSRPETHIFGNGLCEIRLKVKRILYYFPGKLTTGHVYVDNKNLETLLRIFLLKRVPPV